MSDEMPTAHEYIMQLLPADIIFKCDAVKEKIVRCRDCKYMETIDLSSHFDGDHKHDRQECNRIRSFDCFFMPVELDGFCSWGEMRGDHD